MADQGFKSALNSDIDAKVTTNGANENTGSRVNACLSNMADTIFGRGGHHSAYQAGLKLNYKDTVTHLNQIWEWQGTETTSTNWATDSTNFLSIGTAPAYVAAQLAALATVATGRTGSAIAFDVPAEYNTAASPSSGTVTADYTGAVAGTQVLCWFNHGAEPSWPSGWTVVGPWNASAANAVILTYRTGTTVSGVVISEASGTASNPASTYFLDTDFAVTSATPLQVAGMDGIPILAGKLYAIEIVLRGTCSGTSGGYLGLWADTGTDHDLKCFGRSDNVADAAVYFSTGPNSGYNSAATSFPWFASTLPNNGGRLSGTLLGGAVDGVFELRARSVNAAQTFTIYKNGSFMRVTRLN